MDTIEVKRGKVFLKEGEYGSDAYFLNSGRMDVLKILNGNEVKIGELLAGSIFGEICLIDKQTRTSTVLAVENCVIHKINPTNIETIIKKNPKIALAIIRTLSSRFRSTLKLIDSKKLKTR